MKPAEYYTHLRRRFDPTFERDPRLEAGWWEKFEAICQRHQWNQFEAIERAFAFVDGLQPDDLKGGSLSKGYPNLAELCEEHLLQAAFNKPKFVPLRVREIVATMHRVAREATDNGRSLEDVCIDERFAVDRLTAMFVAPSLRNAETTLHWRAQIEKETKDPRVWEFYLQAGFDRQVVDEIKNLWMAEITRSKQPPKKSFDPRRKLNRGLTTITLRILNAQSGRGPRIAKAGFRSMISQVEHLIDTKTGGLTEAGKQMFHNNPEVLSAAEYHKAALQQKRSTNRA